MMVDTQQPAGEPEYADIAIADILAVHGIQFAETTTKNRNIDGSYDVPVAAREMGIACRPIILAAEWWKNDYGHIVGLLREANDNSDGQSRPVALINDRNGYHYIPPGEHQPCKVTAASAGLFEPHAFEITPPLPEKIEGIFDFVRFLLPLVRKDLFTAMRAALVIGCLGVLIPIATGLAIDDLIPGGERSLLIQTGIALLVAALVSFVFTRVRQLALLSLEGSTEHVLQSALWDRLLKLPANFFKQYSSGDLQNRIEGVNVFRRAIVEAALSSVLSAIFAVFYGALLMFYSPLLAGMSLLLITGYLLVTLLAGLRQIKHNVRRLEISGRLAGFVYQLLNGVIKLRSSGAEGKAFAIWSKRFSRERVEIVALRRIAYRFAAFSDFYATVSLALIFVAVIRFSGTNLSTGSFIAFLAAFAGLQAALQGLSGSVLTIVSVLPEWRRARALLAASPERQTGMPDPGRLTGALELTAITFGYNEMTPVLKDVSLLIEPGNHVALVGPSGSGKSSLVRIMLGLETPQQGTVLYDGQDLKGLDVSAVRRQIGVVTQDSKLFAGTIMDNIQGATNATHQQCVQACTDAGFGDDLARLPMGILTPLTDGAATLSGGQRQRLLIARALVKKPTILILDEATSALDNVTQSIVTQSLAQLRITRIVIAHRLSTVKQADEILVMDGGRIVERGTYQSLLKLNGLFARLADRQLT